MDANKRTNEPTNQPINELTFDVGSTQMTDVVNRATTKYIPRLPIFLFNKCIYVHYVPNGLQVLQIRLSCCPLQ